MLTNITVITAALAAIAWVNWYFFFSAGRTARATAGSTGGVQEITVIVKGGYDPATITARAGEPLRIVFDRQETSSCSEEVVFPDFAVKRFLPAFEKTTIELQPEHAGTFGFMCGMSMLHGKLIVEDAR